MSDWTPPGPFQPADAQRIVELGWPFASLGQNSSLDHILRKGVSGKFKTDDFSVIHAGALLTKLGGRVEFLKETPESRSADIRVWFADAPVDAEVTTAEVKVRQEELRGFITALTQAIGIGSSPWNLLIHLGEMPVPEVQTQIVDAVLALGAGGRAGVPDLWDVYAVPLQEEQAFVYLVRFAQLLPAWWKNDGPSLVNTGLTSSSDPSDVRRIHVAAKLPFLSYLNQIRNKVDRPQRNPNNPFLVILDQGSDGTMPMRHQRISDELRQWLPIWPHVSGVLCFDQRPSGNGVKSCINAFCPVT